MLIRFQGTFCNSGGETVLFTVGNHHTAFAQDIEMIDYSLEFGDQTGYITSGNVAAFSQ